MSSGVMFIILANAGCLLAGALIERDDQKDGLTKAGYVFNFIAIAVIAICLYLKTKGALG